MSRILGFGTPLRPLDPVDSSAYDLLNPPYPPYPDFPLFSRFISRDFFDASLSLAWPLGFALVYYVLTHSANHLVIRNGGRDLTKGNSMFAYVLRELIVLHNAILAVYSGWTFAMMAPLVIDFFWQGISGAGFEGAKASMCLMPSTQKDLGRYAYLFYLSKYYEVVDSVILLLKGKKISNLQSYHHAGAIVAMWFAYRYQCQMIWVWCLWNSFVHTLMYSYYFCTAMQWPFPTALKRSLTTLQIAQIASGTIITNLVFITRIDTSFVSRQLLQNRTRSVFASEPPKIQRDVVHYALAMAKTRDPTACVPTTGAEVAIIANNFYMLPLLYLFFRFFVRSYLKRSRGGGREKERAANGVSNGNGNGNVVKKKQ